MAKNKQRQQEKEEERNNHIQGQNHHMFTSTEDVAPEGTLEVDLCYDTLSQSLF